MPVPVSWILATSYRLLATRYKLLDFLGGRGRLMSVKLSVFLRALGLMGYTLEIKKEGKNGGFHPAGGLPTGGRKS